MDLYLKLLEAADAYRSAHDDHAYGQNDDPAAREQEKLGELKATLDAIIDARITHHASVQ